MEDIHKAIIGQKALRLECLPLAASIERSLKSGLWEVWSFSSCSELFYQQTLYCYVKYKLQAELFNEKKRQKNTGTKLKLGVEKLMESLKPQNRYYYNYVCAVTTDNVVDTCFK